MGTDFGPVQPVRGCLLKIIFVIVLVMVAIYTFFQPVWDRLMKIITGN